MRTAAAWCVSRCLPVCALIAACTASSEEVRPPQDQLFFPSGVVVAPDSSVLFVANANSELRYDSGSIGVIDLDTVKKVIDQWRPPAGTDPSYGGDCAPDLDHRETLSCDERIFIRGNAGVRIGNFATDIALQNFGDKYRVIVPTRGDPSIAWADYDVTDGSLSCTADPAHYALCDDAHRLSNVQIDPNQPPIMDEPFGVFADAGPAGTANDYADGFAVVTHLINGAVTLIDSPANGKAQVADVRVNLFAADPGTGLRSATGVAGRTPGMAGDIVYVGSRSEDRIATLTVARPVNNAPPFLLPGNFFFLDAVGGNAGSSADTRGMRFSPTGGRLYVVNRLPPSLQIYDTSSIDPGDPNGFPRNVATGASDICREASNVAVFGVGDDERAYVTCFQDGQLYVVDPRGQSQVEDIISIGRGPYGAVAATLGASSFLFVSNFLEDTIAVVDVTPTSANRNRVVLRIGLPRTQ